MSNDKRAYSWQQFLDSGFDGSDYQFPEFEGSIDATIACKRWDKKNNILVYLDTEDGQKIITSAWQSTNYLGIADIPVGTKIRATFKRSSRGNCFLRSVEEI